MSFEPLIPPALWTALAVGAGLLMAWYGLSRPSIVSRLRWGFIVLLMASGAALVLFVLLNPTWIVNIPPPPGKPLLTILVDSSASMAVSDVADGSTRYHTASQVAKGLSERLSDRLEVRVSTFAASVSPASPEGLDATPPDGTMTDLVTAIGASLQEERPQGHTMVLLSDGIHNAGGGAREILATVRLAKALAISIHTKTFGGEASTWDVAVSVRSPQSLAYVGQKIPITAMVTHRGLSGGHTTLHLFHEGKEVSRQQVSLPLADVAEARFYVSKEKSGLYRYEVQAQALPGEATQANNSAAFQLQVVDEPIRILLLEGKPYWDAKFLMRTLESDPSIALDSLVRLTDKRVLRRTLTQEQKEKDGKGGPGAAETTETSGTNSPSANPSAGNPSGVPSDVGNPSAGERSEKWRISTDPSEVLAEPEALKSYQVIVLGRDAEVFLTEAAVKNLREWVSQEGGSVVCYRGSPTSQVGERLGTLLPVRWTPTKESRFRVHLTEEGQALHWLPGNDHQPASEMLARLPTLSTDTEARRSQPLTVVLATAVSVDGAEERPVISYQHYGEGRVVVIEGAGLWRWAFLPRAAQEKHEVYSTLWQSLVRWLVSNTPLVPGQELALRADKVTFGTNEAATATLFMRAEAMATVPTIELVSESLEEAQTFSPAPFGDAPGTFRIAFGKLPEGRFQARVARATEQNHAVQTVFDVRGLGEEQLNLEARPDLMARIAEESCGNVLKGAQVEAIAGEVEKQVTKPRSLGIRKTVAWDRWWILVSTFLLWGVAWMARRSGGLV